MVTHADVMIELESIDRDLLDGRFGPAAARAMSLLVRYGSAIGATRFISITAAHIDGCLYHGPSSVEFAERFAGLGGRVRVPTTLNSAAVDVAHPELNHAPPGLLAAQRKLIALYKRLGCIETLTCAPYQRVNRPAFGQHIAWGESNAIVFANSVLGARTDRYGDFTDLCAALTARVPLAGLHCDENRQATARFDIVEQGHSGQPRDLYFAAVGYLIGTAALGRVPLLVGLPTDATEDELKALGASAAASGSVALFHALHITPEASTMEQAAGKRALECSLHIDAQAIENAIRMLCPLEPGEPLAAMCVGTPHFSRAEFATLGALVSGRRAAPGVEVYVSTSREVATEIRASGDLERLEEFGGKVVLDTCAYFAPIVRGTDGVIVTNSAKFAHYGPGNLRRRVGLMTLQRCVRSAELGVVAPP